MSNQDRILSHNGESRPLKEWADMLKIDRETIRARLNRLGWDVSRALTVPADRRFRKGGRPRAGAPRPAPKLRRHDATGRAFVRWRAGGKDHTRYFGAWGSAEAAAAYREFMVSWVANGPPSPLPSNGLLLVSGLIARRLQWAYLEYRKAGRLTSEYGLQRRALGVLGELYASLPAAEFDPPRFRAVREKMVANGWARKTVNLHGSRIIAAFAWAVGQGWIPAAVPAALREVGWLKRGRTLAPDHARRKPVADADVNAILPYLSPFIARAVRLASAIRLQRLTGMRPGEVCGLRPCDLDRAGDVWLYTVPPHINKNAHRDKPQTYWIGPRAQADLAPYLDGPAERPVFRVARQGYHASIRRACKLAGVPGWFPHQLRHALATDVARETGAIEAAARAIGDTPATTAKHYVHVDPLEQQKIAWARDHG